jgi:hypothetical protein
MAINIYVSAKGSDNNIGTKEMPFATIQKAIKATRELRRINPTKINEDIHIIISGGVYQILQPIILNAEDGDDNFKTIVEAAPNELPILSGGIQITNWNKTTLNTKGLNKQIANKVWVANVPNVNGNEFNFRQLWVNGNKAIRAKDTKGDLMNRILAWNKIEQTCTIPTSAFDLKNIDGLEMFIHQWWAIANLRIQKVEVNGDSTKLFFHQPESKIQSEHPWPAPWVSKETGNSAFYLTNAIQFLEEPDEWFLDSKNKKLYYYPQANENINTAIVFASHTETIFKIEGTPENVVNNFIFKGLSFQHTGWLRPSLYGHVPHQAGMYMTEAYKLKPAGTKARPTLDNQAWIGRPSAAIQVSFAKNIEVQQCQFVHLASSAVDFKTGVTVSNINGSLFSDIGGNAIVAGNFGDEGREIHIPFNPINDNNICSNINITNNLITNATNEDWSSVGIALGFIHDVLVKHNEIQNVSNTAISLGWGWSKDASILKNNTVANNKIHHFGKHNYDCAGIYTQSLQPNTIISENYIDSAFKAPYAHLPSHWFYLYADEGTGGITFENNWTPTKKYLQNANGQNNIWQNNGPQVSNEIKLNAGVQQQFQYLLKEKAAPYNNAAIAEEHKEIVEIVSPSDSILDLQKLKLILLKSKVDTTSIYQWQNHTVIYNYVQDIGVLQDRLKNNFTKADVKVYYDIVYNYQKQKHCTDKTIAPDWDNIILTANLVADKKMQQQYLDAHATQFEKIPQIALGFCNANFQQLLVFKNDRQLVLVISIPKGESLDKLNPKTTENNPQMIEWNKQMSKYQEGILGTKKGETWVFLKQL